MNARFLLFGLRAVACAWLLSRAAGAEPARFFLEYQAPPSCATREEWLRRLSRRSARAELATASDTAPLLRVVMTALPEGVRVELAASDTDGRGTSRTLAVPTCEEAVEASAWILALWLDPTAGSSVTAEPEPPPPAPPPAVALKSAAHVEPGPLGNVQTVKLRTPASSVSLGAGAEFGSFFTGLPEVPLGIGGYVEARWSQRAVWRPLLELGVLGTGVGVADTERGAVHVSLLTTRARGCPLAWPAHAVVRVSPCLLVELGRLTGRGSDTVGGRDASAFWRTVGASARGELEVGRHLTLAAEAGLVLPLMRDRFVFAPSPVLSGFSTPPVGATLSVAVSGHFPVSGSERDGS